MSNTQHNEVIWCPKYGQVIDSYDSKTKKGVDLNMTLDECKSAYNDPNVQVIHESQVAEMEYWHYYKPAFRIDSDRFDYLQSAHEPTNEVGSHSTVTESFHFGGSYRSKGMVVIAARIGDRYYEMIDRDTLSHDEIVSACNQCDSIAEYREEGFITTELFCTYFRNAQSVKGIAVNGDQWLRLTFADREPEMWKYTPYDYNQPNKNLGYVLVS